MVVDISPPGNNPTDIIENHEKLLQIKWLVKKHTCLDICRCDLRLLNEKALVPGLIE